ncbi:hypothetical protein BH10BAC3_BH10BAC3_28840 [soil metagenome]
MNEANLLLSFTTLQFVMVKTVVNTPAAPAPIGPYNQAIMAGGFLFISGQIAIDPASGDLVLPARETVAVKGLPKSVNVEISMIAYK